MTVLKSEISLLLGIRYAIVLQWAGGGRTFYSSDSEGSRNFQSYIIKHLNKLLMRLSICRPHTLAEIGTC